MNKTIHANVGGVPHLHLLRSTSLAELTKCERKSVGYTAALKSFETDVLGAEAEVDEVLGDGVVVLRINVRDELQQGILQIVRDFEGHSPI
jgi:hypothetical protein